MGKGRLPLGTQEILPSGSASSFHRAAILFIARKSPYGLVNWKPVLGEGQERERRIRHRSFAPILALAAVTRWPEALRKFRFA